MKTILALIDCNNFFVSCERLFRPELEGRPVVVLSSNDGCAISRSDEAKALGIPMGAPAFKYRDLFKRHGVVVFSANFELYGDISERITRLLNGITPRTEVYSVDESFLDLSQLDIANYDDWGRAVRGRILREVGIPVSIGISASKTLSKLANFQAKQAAKSGVLDLYSLAAIDRQDYLRRTAIQDVWGVGWRLGPKLKADGIFTALDLARMRTRHAGQMMGVHGRQMVAELNGITCHQLELIGKARQMVMKGRMFGHDTDRFEVVEAAIASLTARAAFVLRRDGLRARNASVNLVTNRHLPGFVRQDETIHFTTPTADTGRLTAALVGVVNEMFVPGRLYHRANVLLNDLADDSALQPDLLGEVDLAGTETATRRLEALDAINDRYGPRAIHYAAEDLSYAWQPKHVFRSPRYTTNWQELPQITAGQPQRKTSHTPPRQSDLQYPS